MKAIGIISWKGGTGKTTLASNLNERAVSHGLNAVLIDMDPQQNAARHLNFRKTNSPDATPLQVYKGGMDVASIKSVRDLLSSDRYDLMICDLPGADAFTMDQVVDLMDLVMIPLSPSPYDISGAIGLIQHCKEKQWPTWIIPYNLPMGHKRTEQMVFVMESINADVAPVNLKRRVTYVDASTAGLGVCEYDPDSAASDEMNQLWLWTCRQLGLDIDRIAEPSEQEAQYASKDRQAVA